jgi:hypothetical protein
MMKPATLLLSSSLAVYPEPGEGLPSSSYNSIEHLSTISFISISLLDKNIKETV